MIIFKPSKILLWEKIKENSNFPFGIVLDAGFGGVDRYSKIFPRITKLITLDINEKCNPDIVGSVEAIPLEEQSMDSVICTQVIGDIPEPQRAVKEFYRILRKGGIVLLSESFMNELHGEQYDFLRFTNNGMLFLFEHNGFEVLKLERIGGFFSVIAQFKIRYFIERFNLYNCRFLNFLLAPFLKIYGYIMLFFDKLDTSAVNQKFAIGWLVIARKK
ncbi:MAG: class I SAM-dependent methyltransferase [bacterium]